MLGLQPVLDSLFVQEAGHVVDLCGAVAFNSPNALRNLLSRENYLCVCHRAGIGLQPMRLGAVDATARGARGPELRAKVA
jgi:hypothetical protein